MFLQFSSLFYQILPHMLNGTRYSPHEMNLWKNQHRLKGFFFFAITCILHDVFQYYFKFDWHKMRKKLFQFHLLINLVNEPKLIVKYKNIGGNHLTINLSSVVLY